MNTKQWKQSEEEVKRRDANQKAVEEHQSRLLKLAVWRSCLNCINFGPMTRIGEDGKPIVYKHCMLYRQVPPPEVIVHGCRDWEDDIPF